MNDLTSELRESANVDAHSAMPVGSPFVSSSGPPAFDPPLSGSGIELRVIRDGAPARRLRINAARCTFGSGEGCTVRLSDSSLQPLHAVIVREADRVLIRSYSTTIEVNGQATSESLLDRGDVFRLGSYVFETLSLPIAPADPAQDQAQRLRFMTAPDPELETARQREQAAQQREHAAQQQLAEALQQAEQAAQQLEAANAVVAELQQQIDALQLQIETLVESTQTQQADADAQAAEFHRMIAAAEQAESRSQAALREAQQQRDQAHQQVEQLQQQLDAALLDATAAKQQSVLAAQEHAAARQQLDAAHEQLNQLQQLVEQTQQQHDTAQQQLQQALQQRHEALQQQAEILQQRDTLQQQYASTLQQRETLQQQRDTLQQQCDEVLQQRNSLQQQRDEALQQRDTLQQQRDEALRQRDQALAKRSDAIDSEQAAQAKLRQLNQQILQLQQAQAAAESEKLNELSLEEYMSRLLQQLERSPAAAEQRSMAQPALPPREMTTAAAQHPPLSPPPPLLPAATPVSLANAAELGDAAATASHRPAERAQPTLVQPAEFVQPPVRRSTTAPLAPPAAPRSSLWSSALQVALVLACSLIFLYCGRRNPDLQVVWYTASALAGGLLLFAGYDLLAKSLRRTSNLSIAAAGPAKPQSFR